MDTFEKNAVIQFYREQLKHARAPHEALGWNDLESQQKRFEALCRVGDLNSSTILDIGCGTGDLKAYLDLHYHDFSYIGIDHMPEFIEHANKKMGEQPRTFFVMCDFTTDGLSMADYILASGSLSYRSANAMYPFSIIRKMYQHARKAVAFNLLDGDYRYYPAEHVLKGYNRYEILSYCLRLATRAELVTGYLADDFTIMLYK
jgi:SAM-dependent methyltransferase